MISSPTDVRKGSQEPRIESYPLFHTTAADDAIDVALLAGLTLDPWQEYILRGSLGERVDGKWSAFRTCVVVPRQNGKNALIEARELAGLLLFNESVIIHTAHEFKTAYKSMIALMNRLRTSPLMEYVKGFDGEVEDIREIDGFKTGNNPGITMKNGNVLQYAARSKGSGRGFTGDLVILDEAYALKAAEMDALLPTMAAKSIDGNPQVWFTSSAGMPESDLLASLRKQGINKTSERLAYYEWSVPDDTDPLDREGWYQANPGLGYRISEEFIQDEYDTMTLESAGSDEGFKRERLGIWAKLGSEPVFPPGVWERQQAAKQSLKNPVLAVDVRGGLNQSASFVVAGGTSAGTQVHVARYEPGAGKRWSEDHLKDLTISILEDRGLASVAVDAYAENEDLIVKLIEAGVEVVKLNQADMANGAVAFTSGLINARIWHSPSEILDAAVAGAAKKTYRETLHLWSPLRSTADITSLRAATAAWWVYTSLAEAEYDVLDSIG